MSFKGNSVNFTTLLGAFITVKKEVPIKNQSFNSSLSRTHRPTRVSFYPLPSLPRTQRALCGWERTEASCPTWWVREVKIPRRRRPRKRRLKSEFAFFQSLLRLLSNLLWQMQATLFRPNSYEPYWSSERERNFSHRLFTSSIKCEIRHFPVVVVQWRYTLLMRTAVNLSVNMTARSWLVSCNTGINVTSANRANTAISPLSQQKMEWLLFPIGSLGSVTTFLGSGVGREKGKSVG